jgi:hypothetical protein
MTAQLSDAGNGVVRLPRTIRAIRAALPAERRSEFQAELDDMDAGGLAQVVETWWARAVVWSSPTTTARLAECDAGTGEFVDARDLFQDVAWPAQ